MTRKVRLLFWQGSAARNKERLKRKKQPLLLLENKKWKWIEVWETFFCIWTACLVSRYLKWCLKFVCQLLHVVVASSNRPRLWIGCNEQDSKPAKVAWWNFVAIQFKCIALSLETPQDDQKCNTTKFSSYLALERQNISFIKPEAFHASDKM